MLTEFVIPYVRTSVIRANWGATVQSYQVLELRIFGTTKSWSKSTGEPLDKFIGKAKNRYSIFEKKATKVLGDKVFRVFIVMPLQGEKFGTQDDQRIFKEYDSRFEAIQSQLGKLGAVAIRIDREYTLDELVKRIKDEIEKSAFVVADLTDERPSCYFESGYAEALKKPIIYVASKESVIYPRTKTHIHFDIHKNILMFTNHKELKEKLKASIEANRERLFVDTTEE